MGGQVSGGGLWLGGLVHLHAQSHQGLLAGPLGTSLACKDSITSITSGHRQFRVLPFGLHGAPERFQWLSPQWDYAAAYLDDVIIHWSTE